jgi:hypothetical protein
MSVECVDSDKNVQLWNYIECQNESRDDVKKERGLVKNSEGDILVQSFGYTDEYSEKDIDTIETLIPQEKFDEWTFYYGVEGTLLRMFFQNDQWYLSTHKKLDAFQSRWSCKQSFGELFQESLEAVYNKENVLEWFQNQLSIDNVYFFFIRANIHNRIVCHVHVNNKKDSILYLGHYTRKGNPEFVFYKKGTAEPSVLNELHESESIPKQLDTVRELCAHVQTLDPFQCPGIIGFHPSFRTLKILNSQYSMYANIRGNNPNVCFRYLELRNDPEKVKLLYVLYPRHTLVFDEYESTLYDIARMIYHSYIQRYIKNQYITLPREEYLLLKKCHEWYLQDRRNNRIYTKKIMEIMANEPCINLYKMIRRCHIQGNYHTYRHDTNYSSGIEMPVLRRFNVKGRTVENI